MCRSTRTAERSRSAVFLDTRPPGKQIWGFGFWAFGPAAGRKLGGSGSHQQWPDDPFLARRFHDCRRWRRRRHGTTLPFRLGFSVWRRRGWIAIRCCGVVEDLSFAMGLRFFSLHLILVLEELGLVNSDFTFCIELPVKAKLKSFKMTDFPSFERSRISGKKKVNEFKDGFLILLSIIRLFIKTKWKKKLL